MRKRRFDSPSDCAARVTVPDRQSSIFNSQSSIFNLQSPKAPSSMMRSPAPATATDLYELTMAAGYWAMPEGAPFFAGEPLLTVAAPILEAQIVETALLALVCYPTSVATKAARVVAAAGRRDVVEFGARRAPGTDAALIAARAAVVG